MATYRIELRPEAVDDLARLPHGLQQRLVRVMETRLETAPAKYGLRLAQSLAGFWKLRTGDYRVVFELFESQRRVVVWGVRHRKDIYPETKKRWRSVP